MKAAKYENLKIVDFGSSRQYDTNSNNLITGDDLEKFSPSTPYYMAPELIGEKPAFNHKVDIWSCGIIAYILLFSNPPYRGKDDQTVRDEIRDKSTSVPMNDAFWTDGSVSEDCKAFVRKLLTHDVTSRPNAKDLLDPITGDKWLREKAVIE